MSPCPVVEPPKSLSPFKNTSRPLFPLTYGATSSNFPVVLSFSIFTACSVTLFLNNRDVFFHRRNTNSVSVFLRIHNRLLDGIVDRRLDRTHKPRAHINALGAQRQRRREPLPVREAPRSNKRHTQTLPRPAQQDEIRDIVLANMSRTLKTIDRQKIYAELDGALRVAGARWCTCAARRSCSP